MDAETFERMRRTLGVYATHWRGVPETHQAHPVRVLDAISARTPSAAGKGLRMAIGDMVEDLSHASADQAARLDALLAEHDAMTLGEARLLFSRRLKSVRRRGVIAGEEEYYLVRNAAEFARDDERAELWRLLVAFESTIAK